MAISVFPEASRPRRGKESRFVYISLAGLGFQIHPPQQVSEARVVPEGPNLYGD